jgi:hypothetical protein
MREWIRRLALVFNWLSWIWMIGVVISGASAGLFSGWNAGDNAGFTAIALIPGLIGLSVAWTLDDLTKPRLSSGGR